MNEFGLQPRPAAQRIMPTLRYLKWLTLAKLGYNPNTVNPHLPFILAAKLYWRMMGE